jgi:hypothetical protein
LFESDSWATKPEDGAEKLERNLRWRIAFLRHDSTTFTKPLNTHQYFLLLCTFQAPKPIPIDSTQNVATNSTLHLYVRPPSILRHGTLLTFPLPSSVLTTLLIANSKNRTPFLLITFIAGGAAFIGMKYRAVTQASEISKREGGGRGGRGGKGFGVEAGRSGGGV